MVPAYINASAQITLFNCAETSDFAIYPDQNYNPALSRSQSRALKASHYTRNLCGKWPKSDHVCEPVVSARGWNFTASAIAADTPSGSIMQMNFRAY
jgi:hypothetical protein